MARGQWYLKNTGDVEIFTIRFIDPLLETAGVYEYVRDDENAVSFFVSYDIFQIVAHCPLTAVPTFGLETRRDEPSVLLDRDARRRNSVSTRDSWGIERRASI